MSLAYDAEPTSFWQQMVTLYRAEAAQTSNPREAAELLVEAGEVLAEQLDAIDDAYAAFDAAQARAPEAVAPLLARARLAQAQADWTEAAECLRATLGRMNGPRRVPVLSTLARICARHLGRPEEAVRLLQEAATLAPDQRDLLIRLEAARPATETSARRDVLERRLAVTTSLAERGERLAELGGLLEATAPARAARTFADAYAANPSCEAAVHGLVRTYVDLKRWAQLHRVLSTHAERITDDAVRAQVYAICGVIADAHLDDPDRALADLAQAGPSTDVAYERALVRDRAGRGSVDWWAEHADPLLAPERDWHLAAAGRARLDGPLGALIERRRALASGDDEAATKATATLIRRADADEDGRVLQLAACDLALWSTAPQDARPASIAAVALQSDPARFPEGLVTLRAAGRTAADLEAWRAQIDQVMQRGVDPSVAMALQRWQAMNDPTPLDAAQWIALAEDAPGHIGAVDMALQLAPDDADLTALLDAAIAEAQSDSRRIRLLLLAAERAATRGDHAAAQARWRAVLALDPLEVTARGALGQALNAAGDAPGLAALAAAELEHLPVGDERRREAWLRRLRALAAEPRALADAFAAAVDELPDDPAIRLAARRHADVRGDDAALQQLLGLESPSPIAARIDALERAGVALDLGETDAARAALDAVLADAPADVVGAWVRAQLALAGGDIEGARALTRQQLATARTSGLARIQAHRLTAQLPLAEARALMAERAADDADAAWYMLCDAAAAADMPGVIERLEQLAALVDDRSARALLIEAGERAEALGLPIERRLALWEQVADDATGRSAQMLLAGHAEAEDQNALVEALLAVANASEGPQRATALWRAGLEIEDTQPLEASRFYWQAIEAWPDEPMPLLLSLRVGESGAPMTGAERAQQLEAIAARLVHDGRAARLLSAAATTRKSNGEDALADQDWLHAALRFPERDALAERAIALLSNDDQARIALLESRVRRTSVPATRAAARHQLAREYIDVFGDREAAAAIFAEIVAANPDDLGARREYARLLIGLGRHAQAVEQYRIAADTVPEVSERVALFTRIGELLARHLDDLDGAIEALRQAIGLVDPTGRAQEVLAEVYLRAGEGHRALLAYQRLERMVSDPVRRAHAQAGQVRALIADGRDADAAERLLRFLKQDPFEPQLTALARSLGVEVPEPEVDEQATPPPLNGIDLAELDRLQAALDETQARKSAAKNAVSQASAEAAAVLDSEAFDVLAAALAQVTGEPADVSPEPPVSDAPAEPIVEPPAPEVDAAAEQSAPSDAVEPATPPAFDTAQAQATSGFDADAARAIDSLEALPEATDDVAVADSLESVDADFEAAAEDALGSLEAVDEGFEAEAADAIDSLEAVDEGFEAAAADAIDSLEVVDESFEAEAADAIDSLEAVDEGFEAEAADAIDSLEAVDEGFEAAAADAIDSLEVVDEGFEVDAADVIDSLEIAPAVDEAEALAPEVPPLDLDEPEAIVSGEETPPEHVEPTVDPTAEAAQADLRLAPEVDAIALEETDAPATAELSDAPIAEPPPPPVPAPAEEAAPADPPAAHLADQAALANIFESIDISPESIIEAEALPPPPMASTVDPDDFEEFSSIELEEWEIEEVDDDDPPLTPVRSMPPPVPVAAPPSSPTPAAPSSDTLAALRDVHSALGDPAPAPVKPPARPVPAEAGDVLADLFARVDAVVDQDAPQSELLASVEQTPISEALAVPDDSIDLVLDVPPSGESPVDDALEHDVADAPTDDPAPASGGFDDVPTVVGEALAEDAPHAAFDEGPTVVGEALSDDAPPADLDTSADASVDDRAPSDAPLEEPEAEDVPADVAAFDAGPTVVGEALTDESPDEADGFDDFGSLGGAFEQTPDAADTDDFDDDPEVEPDDEVEDAADPADGIGADADDLPTDGFADDPKTAVREPEADSDAAEWGGFEPVSTAVIAAEDAEALRSESRVDPMTNVFAAQVPTVVIADEEAEALRAESADPVAEAESTTAPPANPMQQALVQDAATQPPLDAFFGEPSAGPAPVAPDLFDGDLVANGSVDQFSVSLVGVEVVDHAADDEDDDDSAEIARTADEFAALLSGERPTDAASHRGDPTDDASVDFAARVDDAPNETDDFAKLLSDPPDEAPDEFAALLDDSVDDDANVVGESPAVVEDFANLLSDPPPEAPDEFAALLDDSPDDDEPTNEFAALLDDSPDDDEPTNEFTAPNAPTQVEFDDEPTGDFDASAAPAPTSSVELSAFSSLIGAGQDDFFGDGSAELEGLFDDGLGDDALAPARAEEDSQAPTAAIMRAGRRSLESRATSPSTAPAAVSVERADGAASLAAAMSQQLRTDPEVRVSQALAAVALRRQADGQMDAAAARGRIASAPLDDEAWANLRIASRSAGAARWIADMRAWIDGRLHAGSLVTASSRVPDALRDELLPDTVPRAVIRLLRALRTRVPLALAQDERPDGLAVLAPNEPLTAVADRIAVALGCPMHDLMADRLKPYSLSVVADAVPIACVGNALLARVPPPGRSFAVGRCLASLSEGTLPAEVLDDRGFAGFLAAVFHLFALTGFDADAAATSAALRWLRPVIDPSDARLEALVLDAARSIDFARIPAIRRGLVSAAHRLALALSDGLGGALEVVRLLDLDERPLAELTRHDLNEFVAGNSLAEELICCAASAPCIAIRDWLTENR